MSYREHARPAALARVHPPRRALELAGYEQGGPLDVEPAGSEQAIRAAAGSG